MKIRTFLSLNLNSSLKEKISEIQKKLQVYLKEHPIKWEDPEKFHLTLRFLGDIEENSAEQLKNDLESIEFDFDMLNFQSSGIGFFPNPKRPNVVFVELHEDGNNTEQLLLKLDEVINKYGIKPDKKFVAHITMGRFRRENRNSVRIENMPHFEPFEVVLTSFYLMKSVLNTKGSVHSVLKEFKFKKNF
jgi:2'-5' RNA ligase